MLKENYLDRALQKSQRLLNIRNSQMFRCKEPLAQELMLQFSKFIPSLCQEDSKSKLIIFAQQLKKWIDKNYTILNDYFGPQVLSPLPNWINKRQPHLIEAIFGTLLKCELISRYLPLVKSFSMGCVLGGSLSYGKFFNVRQELPKMLSESPASDIDLLLIGNLTNLNEIVTKHKSQKDFSSIYPTETNKIMYGLIPLLNVSINQIKDINLDPSRVVISKKFNIEDTFEIGKLFYPSKRKQNFDVSLHVISFDCFKFLTSPLSYPRFNQLFKKKVPMIYDIRIDYELPEIMVYSTMEGIIVPESVSTIKKNEKGIQFGKSIATISIAELPAYMYWEGRYVSGVYQNLLIPRFEILIDNKKNDITEMCDNLKKFLHSECVRELSIFQDSDISISRLHPRHFNFPQAVCEEIDKTIEIKLTQKKESIENSYGAVKNIKIRENFHNKYGIGFSLYDEIYEISKLANKEDVLDLGCGIGNFLIFLKSKGHKGKTVGIDLLDLRKNSIEEFPGKFIKGDIQNISKAFEINGIEFPYFDVIFALHVLYHLPELSSTLEGVIKHLRSGGRFITSTNSNRNLSVLHDIIRRALLENNIGTICENHYNIFSTESAMEILREYFLELKSYTYETEIVVKSKNDIVKYLSSNFDNYDISKDIDLRKSIVNSLNIEVGDLLKKGPLKDRKIVTIIKCSKQIIY